MTHGACSFVKKLVLCIFYSILISKSHGKVDLSPELIEVLQRKSNFKDPDNRIIVAFKTATDPMENCKLKLPLEFLQTEEYRAALGTFVVSEMNAENWDLEQMLLELVEEEQIVRRLPIGNTFILEGLDMDQANNISQLERTVLLALSQYTPDTSSKSAKFKESPHGLYPWDPSAECDHLHKSTCETHSNLPWNIQKIKAQQAWSLGFKGKGIVYGVIDTGVSYKHPILAKTYKGLRPDGSYEHNYAWFDAVRKEPKITMIRDRWRDNNRMTEMEEEMVDGYEADIDSYDEDLYTYYKSTSTSTPSSIPVGAALGKCGYGLSEPCDAVGHGTHVATTAIGGFGYGIAPEATWMACRSLSTDIGREEDSLACFNFFLAPHDVNGRNPRPELRPHVIGNSYEWESWAEVIGAGIDLAVRRLEAAGTVMVFAAGNSGPGCGTIHSAFSFIVGATTELGTIAPFSSRGPWTISPAFSNSRADPRLPLLIKPDIAAPGDLIVGAIGDQHLTKMSGTSMATPHVSGSIALLLQACPHLIGRPVDIQQVLQQSARKMLVPASAPFCGRDTSTSTPNNYFGAGELDIEAAINLCVLKEAV